MTTIYFYKAKEQYGAFSNFSRHAIYVSGKIWRTSEHYYQAMKFEHEDHQEEIRIAKTPTKARELGNSQEYSIREGWDERWRVRIMMTALRAKFTQHPDLKELLLGTRDAKLVEHTFKDSYWGDGGDGSGENMLGQLLMDLRHELAEGEL